MTENYNALSKFSLLIKFPRRISIDCGTILTKVINVNNTSEEVIKYLVFLTRELERYLQSLLEDLKNSEEVYITGSNRWHARSVVGSLVSTKVVLVEEMEAMSKGFKILLDNIDESEVLYNVNVHLDEIEIATFDENNEFIKRMLDKINSDFRSIILTDDQKIKRPSVLMWAGATIKFYLLKEDGNIELIGMSYFGGETFRGMSKILVDSNNYDHITSLAYSGRRGNIDTQIKDVFVEDPNSPYGVFPPEFPTLPFGKFEDLFLGKKDVCIEDLMASWSHMILSENLYFATQLCQAHRAKLIYVGGALFLAPVFEKHNQLRDKANFGYLKTKILDCNYLLALGALLMNS